MIVSPISSSNWIFASVNSSFSTSGLHDEKRTSTLTKAVGRITPISERKPLRFMSEFNPFKFCFYLISDRLLYYIFLFPFLDQYIFSMQKLIMIYFSVNRIRFFFVDKNTATGDHLFCFAFAGQN